MVDLQTEIDELWQPLTEAVHRVLRSGRFILGPEGESLEAEVASFLGARHAIGVNSGTDALRIGLRAAGIGPGDEVITTPFTFFATVEAIVDVGAEPVFVDLAPSGFNLDPSAIERALSPRTRAILPVHVFGEPVAMDVLLDVASSRSLAIVEDCAQAFGAPAARTSGRDDARPLARAGTSGTLGAFSFYPSKNLGAYGDAGMIVTDDDDVARAARALRNHGSDPSRRYQHAAVGHNSRLDELQAAILRVKLPHVEAWNAARRAAAQRYDSLLAGVDAVTTPPAVPGHVYHQYTVRVPSEARDRITERLRSEGIAMSVFYPPAATSWPSWIGERTQHCTRAAVAASEVVSLPMHPHLTRDDQERVTEVLCTALT